MHIPHEPEHLYRNMFMSNPNPMWIFDLDTLVFLDVNEAAVRHYGYTREEFLSMSTTAIRLQEDVPQYVDSTRSYRTLPAGPMYPVGVFRHRKKDGTLIWVEVAAQIIEFQGRQGNAVIVHDVTHRFHNESLLSIQNEILRSITTGASLPQVLDQLCLRIEREVPHGRCSIYFYDSKNSRLHSGRAPSLPKRFMTAADGIQINRKTGTRGPAIFRKSVVHTVDVMIDPFWKRYRGFAKTYGIGACTSVPVLGTQDQVLAVYALYHAKSGPSDPYHLKLLEIAGYLASVAIEKSLADKRAAESLAERKRMEDGLRQSQKMESIGRLAGGIAHDFNNLMTIISGQTELMMRELAHDHAARRHATKILTAGSRAADLTGKLMSFSRNQHVELRTLDLNEFVRESESMLKALIGGSIELKIRLGQRPLRILGDSSQLMQILLNLASNAKDAMPRGGALKVEVQAKRLSAGRKRNDSSLRDGDYAVLSVSDSGTGMDKDVVTHLFEPFFTTKEVGKGTGLGLAIVFGLVKSFGGGMAVKSTFGKGSRFDIYFRKVAKEKSARPASAPPKRDGLRRSLPPAPNAAHGH